jgi:hypothetical protein
MAVLKIYQSQTRVKDPQVAQTGALTLPVGLATNYGKAISSVGAVVEKIALENKAEEDANEASDIITGVNQKIAENYNKYSKSLKTEDVLNFTNELNDIQFDGSNKQVNELVNKHIRKQSNSLSLDLTKKILGNSISKSRSRKDDEVLRHIQDMTSSDPVKRITGGKNYNLFFNSAENITFYGEEEIKKKKQEYDQLLLKNTFIKKIDNREIDLLDPKVVQDIKDKFGDRGAKGLLEKVRATKISDVLNEEENERLNEQNRYQNQLFNFTKLIDNLNRGKYDNTVTKPTLDQIHDLYDLGNLNTAQYNALVKFYSIGAESTDYELLDIINTQIAAARNVTDLDDLQRALTEDKSILDRVDPNQIVDFNNLIEKYKGDVLGITDYKKYQELLKTHVGDIDRVITFTSSGSNNAGEKIKSMNALEEYNRHITNGENPEDAYLETISKFSEKELPKPEDLPMPIGFELTDVKESLNKNPDNAFDTLYKKAVDKFKKDGNIEEYKENIKRLDFIQDVFKVRKSIFPEMDNKYLGKFAIKKAKKGGDKPKKKGFTQSIKEGFNDIKEYFN